MLAGNTIGICAVLIRQPKVGEIAMPQHHIMADPAVNGLLYPMWSGFNFAHRNYFGRRCVAK